MHDKDIVVGEYSVDLLVDDVLLVELETFKALDHPAPGAGWMHQLFQDDGPLLRLLLSFSKPQAKIQRVAMEISACFAPAPAKVGVHRLSASAL